MSDDNIHKQRKIGEIQNSVNNVEHVIISYNEEDQSYGIEGKKSYQSVVEVVRNYVASRDYALEPFTESLEVNSADTGTKNESTQVEQPPPAYTKYPIDKQHHPQIKTKLDDVNKVQEGKPLPKSTFRRFRGSSERGCCYGACDSGYNWYDICEAGWLLRIFLVILYGIVIVSCGLCLLTGGIILVLSLKLCSTEVGCCDKCGYWCGCESFCEEHFVCCDDD